MTSPQSGSPRHGPEVELRKDYARRMAEEVLEGTGLVAALEARQPAHRRYNAVSPMMLRGIAHEAREVSRDVLHRTADKWRATHGDDRPPPTPEELSALSRDARTRHHAFLEARTSISHYLGDLDMTLGLCDFGWPGRVVWERLSLRRLASLRKELGARTAGDERATKVVDRTLDDVAERVARWARREGVPKGVHVGDHIQSFARAALTRGRVVVAAESALNDARLYEGMTTALERDAASPLRIETLEATADDVERRFGAFYATHRGRALRSSFDPANRLDDSEVTEAVLYAATGFEQHVALTTSHPAVYPTPASVSLS